MDPAEARREASGIVRTRLWREMSKLLETRKVALMNQYNSFELRDVGSLVARERLLGQVDEITRAVKQVNTIANGH